MCDAIRLDIEIDLQFLIKALRKFGDDPVKYFQVRERERVQCLILTMFD